MFIFLQAEQETWQERWYQTRKVQKVVQDSKIYSKVRTNIKIKLKPEDAESPPVQEFPGTSAKDLKAEALRRKAANKNPQNKDLPLMGSVDEYSKLPKNPAENKESSSEESADEEEEEGEGDGLWSAIMGKK